MKFIKFYLQKDKINHKKIIMYTKYNLIIITSNEKKYKTQIYNDKLEITKVNWHFPILSHNFLLTYLPPLLPLVPNFYFLMYVPYIARPKFCEGK
jgi:hypothetical protein